MRLEGSWEGAPSQCRSLGSRWLGYCQFSIIRVIEILQDIVSGKGSSMSDYNGLGIFRAGRDIILCL